MEIIYLYILAGGLGLVLVWCLWLTTKYRAISKKAAALFSDDTPGNLAQVIEKYLKSVKEVEDHGFAIEQQMKKIRKMAEDSYQRMGFVRYNPFGDVGGNLSFSVCLLDTKNSGFVISSIHSREGTRVYSKTVRNGDSEYNLSEEEKKAIQIALKGKGEQNV